jgi:5-methylcytosine-specific restriction endonuclease McrBC regulatory subunit McrC
MPIFLGAGLHGIEFQQFSMRSLFIDMEYLFECSVLKRLQTFSLFSCLPGKEFKVRIFGQLEKRYKCEPDLVLLDAKNSVFAVGDVKYKNMDSSGPSNDDIYQLMVHAQSFESRVAFIVYPGEEFSEQFIGHARDGTAVSAFRVRPGCLEEDVGMLTKSISNQSERSGRLLLPESA